MATVVNLKKYEDIWRLFYVSQVHFGRKSNTFL